jgi:site-specific recombinase XerD
MAFLYKRVRSPYWWIRYFDDTGRKIQESTGCRWDSVQQTRDARKIRAAKEIIEVSAPASRRNVRAFDQWVQGWLDSLHKNDGTLECYTGAWKNLSTFFDLHGVRSAADVTRDHCFQYMDWRMGKGNKNFPRRKVCRNTAINDLRILRKVLYEAYNREWIDRNPAAKLGIERDAPPQKPVITDAERAIVEGTFSPTPDWREISWTIAINQGCRLKETSLPLSDVDFEHDTITFTLKGGRRHTTRLMPAVKDLLLRLRDMGCTRTWEFHRLASRDWSRIFHGLGLNFSFHSTRVTVITRLARAGVNEQMARRFIGHASSEIHAIYTRLEAGDLDSCVRALDGTPPSGDKPGSNEIPPVPERKRIGRPAKTRRV